ncbi:hypothetical protein HHI36_002186 [Cryptolaemus montrouzieri]|uniref:Uncharacterized protein n=1 Tax=Cryptolaemus montrouzieri TaxID=559131 RepID=A0ABD2P9P2_9CUCU
MRRGREKDNIKIIRWMDKRPIMSTTDPSHTVDATWTTTRPKKASILVSSYHTAMRKSLKRYRKVAFELILGTSVVIIYNTVSNTKIVITQLRRQLAKELVTIESGEAPASTLSERKRVHTFEKPDGAGLKQRKFCRGCYNDCRSKGLSSREEREMFHKCKDFPNNLEFFLS